ncbi:hypothetical protein ACFQS4_04100 [Saliphagus sp. GCM10025317]
MGSAGPTSYVVADFSADCVRVLPRHPYEIDLLGGKPASRLTADETVIDASTLSPRVRSVVETAVEGSRDGIGTPAYGTESPSDAVVRIAEEYDYVRTTYNGTPVVVEFEAFENDLERPPLLAVEATLVRDRITSDDPAKISFSLINRNTESMMFDHVRPWPFGVPVAHLLPQEKEGIQLWNDRYIDAYGASRFDSLYAHPGVDRRRPGRILVGETIRREYLLPIPVDAEPGRYRITDYLQYFPDDCRKEVLRYEITFELRRR